MTDIPTTAAAFTQWYVERREEWPPDLQHLGDFARLSLDYLDQPNENRHASLDEKARKDLIAFAEAYGRWDEDRPRR